MGYSLRESSSVNLVEEKKEDGGGDSELCLGDRGIEKSQQEPQQQLPSDVTDTDENNNIITAQLLSANNNNNNIAPNFIVAANEPSAMQQDPIDDLHSQNSNDGGVNQLHALSLAAQVASNQQQTQLMTSSLNSLQLNNVVHQHQQQQPSTVLPSLQSVVGSNSFNSTSGVVSNNNVIPHALQPQTVAHIQQQVLAQQQAAAHAAAMSIGSLTSSQTQLTSAPVVHQGVLPANTSSFVQGGAVPSANIISPLLARANNVLQNSQKQQQQQEQNSLVTGTGGTLGMSTAGSTNAVLNAPSIIPSTVLGAANNAIISPSCTPHHQLSPQLTIPHYVPPIPATWGAQLPTLSVQDRPLVPPIYNGINPNYPGAQLLHAHPPIFIVENFLNGAECDFLIEAASDAFGPAPVVGKGSGEVSPSRTSSTCYLAREDLPEYLRKVSLLTGKPAEHCELPQVGRYYPNQQYLQHFDAFDLSNDDGRRFAANGGGQRTVTVLVYLNDVPRGGATAFPALNIEVQPRRGMALVFFPSTLDGLLDKMCLHAALPAVDLKYVSQVWIRQSNYEGTPSKRLAEPMVAGLQERRDAAHKLLLQQQIQQQAAAVAHHQQQIVAQQLQQQHNQAAQIHQQQHNCHHQQQQNQGYQQMN